MNQGQSRSYDKEFKLNAIKLYHSSGRTCCQLGKELGIPKTTLAAWVRKYKQDGVEAFPGKGFLREERDILKNPRKELLCPEGQKLSNAEGMMSVSKEAAVRFWWYNPVKKRGSGTVAHLTLATLYPVYKKIPFRKVIFA